MRRCTESRSAPEILDPRRELENAAQFSRSFDPGGAWTASCRAIEAARRMGDPGLAQEAELAAARFAERERAWHAEVEQRMRAHEANEWRSVQPIAEPPPPRAPSQKGPLARIGEAVRAVFSSPRAARSAG